MIIKKLKQKLPLFLVMFSVLMIGNATPAHAIGMADTDVIESVSDWVWAPDISEIASRIPNRLLRGEDSVEVGDFNTKVRGQTAWKEDGGWVIERDRGGDNSHGGSYWKLKKPNGKRVATLDEDGKILRD